MVQALLKPWQRAFRSSFIEFAQSRLHQSLRENAAVRHRARILLLLCYFFIALLFFVMLLCFFVPLKFELKLLIFMVWFLQIVGQSVVAYALRVKGNYALAAFSFLLSLAILYFVSILISGGPIQSPLTKAFFILPIIAFFLIGVRGGIFWTTSLLTILLSIFALDKLAVPFINVISDDVKYLISVICFYSGLFFIVFMILLYENTFIGLQYQQRKSEAQTRHLATHDQLTGIANRTYFYQALDNCIFEHQKNKKRFAFIYMDLVGFKEINDLYGHHTGDLVLQKIALRLNDGVRSTDLVARHGGDEFVFLLNNVKDTQALEGLANKIAAMVSEPILLAELRLQVFASMGIALFPDHALDSISLERFADAAMYQAKTNKCDWKIYAGLNP